MNRVVQALAAAVLAALLWREAPAEGAADLKDQLLDSAGSQKERIRALAQKGTPFLTSLLKSEDRIVRCSAIMALGLAGTTDRDAAAQLVELSGGKDTEDAYFAIIALGHSRAPQAQAVLARASKSGNPGLREAACHAIGECRDPRLYPVLDALVEDGDEHVKAIARLVRGRLQKAGREQTQPKP